MGEADTSAVDTTANTTGIRGTVELIPHMPEYSDVGFLSQAEMAERRQSRCAHEPTATDSTDSARRAPPLSSSLERRADRVAACTGLRWRQRSQSGCRRCGSASGSA